MIKKSLLALAMGAAVFAGAAQAQMPANMPGEAHPMHMQGQDHAKARGDHFAKRHQQHMEKLKQSLKLSADQTGAWTAFESAMQPPAFERPDHNAVAKMTTPERLDFMSKMKAQHDAQMQKRLDATRTFYAALTPEQKKTFDQETGKFMQGHGHQHGEHGQHPGH